MPRSTIADRPRDPRHGTRNGYSNLGCRCKRCKAAIAEATRVYKHRTGRSRPREQYRAELAASPPPHGTESRYNGRGCRCELCREAAAEGRRARRHADMEAARAYDRAYKRARAAA